jgi:hypothetical protein
VHNSLDGAEIDPDTLKELDGLSVASEPHQFRLDSAISNRIL